MKFLHAVVMALAVILTAPLCRAATPSEWRRDIDQMVHDIRATHPAPFARVGELTFMRQVAAFKASIPAMTEAQRMAGAMRLVGLIGEGHSRLEPDTAAFALWYPIRIYEFTDGYFIIAAHQDAADLVGAQILDIGGRPVAVAAADARTLFGADNDFDAMERLYALHNARLMEGLGYADTEGVMTLRVRLADGRTVTRNLSPLVGETSRFDWTFRSEMSGTVGPPDRWISAYRGLRAPAFRTEDPARPAYMTSRRPLFSRALPQQDAYYIQASVVGSVGGQSFPAFFRQAMAQVDAQRPKHLIVDLRYNYGGDGSNIPAMIAEFTARRNDRPWTNLYVLTGRRTFSAGVMAVTAFIDQVGATVVGEPAGAPRNTYGDTNTFDYPGTGMRMYVSFERHEMGKSTDVDSYIPVDVPARFTFADYAEGRDPAVDAILAGEEMRSIAAVATADGGEAAARLFRERSERFGDLPWWTPPTEMSLRMVMRSLQDQGKSAEAISVAELNTVVHPEEWRTWMNLGDLLAAAGRRPEAIENYRRSVALGDPTNFNAERLSRLIAVYDRETAAAPTATVAPLAFRQPPEIRFGASLAETLAALEGKCAAVNVRPIQPAFLPRVQTRQQQIDCDGYVFMGAPRWAEFVIGDDRLQMVWIMVRPDEQAAMIGAMTTALGAPSRANGAYIAFESARSAWRNQPAEVLFYAPELDDWVSPWFTGT